MMDIYKISIRILVILIIFDRIHLVLLLEVLILTLDDSVQIYIIFIPNF